MFDEKLKISKEKKEAEIIKDAINDGVLRERLNKLIGNMMTADLRLLHYRLIEGYKTPTAEELVEDLKVKN